MVSRCLRWSALLAIPVPLGLAVCIGWVALSALPARLSVAYGSALCAIGITIGLLARLLRRTRQRDERRPWWMLLAGLGFLLGWLVNGPGVWLVGHRTPVPAWGAGCFLLAHVFLSAGLAMRGDRWPHSLIGLAALLGDNLLILGACALIILERGQLSLLLPFRQAAAVPWAYAVGMVLLLGGVATMLSGPASANTRGPRWLLACGAGVLVIGDAALARLPLIIPPAGFPLTALLWTLAVPCFVIAAYWELAARPRDATQAGETDAYLTNNSLLPSMALLLVGAGLALRDSRMLLQSEDAVQLWGLLCLLLLFALLRVVLHGLLSRQAYQALLRRVRESERVAVTDPLTGLPNKRACLRRLEDEISRAARYKRPLAVIYADLDFFKLINDLHGHAAGDLALCAAAYTLQERVRTTDMAARMGGEEFVLILPETTLSQADILAERLRVAIEALRPTLPTGTVLQMTISLGIAAYPETSETADGLLQDADEAMGRAKEAGRNRVMPARAKCLLFVFE